MEKSATQHIFLESNKMKNFNSGLGQFSYYLVKELILNKPNYKELDQFSFFVNGHNTKISSLKSFHTHNHKFYQTNFLHKLSRRFSPESILWHAFHQDSPFLPKKSSTPYILTIHDLNFLYKERSLEYKEKKLQKLQKKIDRASYLTTISEFTLNDVKKNLQVPKSLKTKVIYNGVESVEQFTAPSFIKSDDKFLFTIGIIQEKKNFHILIDFIKKLSGIKLVIAGDKSSKYANNILNEIKKFNLEDKVILPGKIPESEKAWLYKNCQAFIFPSLHEGFGIPVIEAMRQGKAVYCFKNTSLPEVAGKYAYFFETSNTDYMVNYFNETVNEIDDTQLQKNRIEWSNKFSWEKSAKEYLTIYKEFTQ